MIRFNYLSREDLLREEVLRAADEHRLVEIVEENSIEVKALISKVYKRLKLCKVCLAPAVSMHNVRMYLDYMINEQREYFDSRYSTKSKRVKFLCEIIGALLEHGVYQGTPGEMATLLDDWGKDRESLRKYISEGRRNTILKKILDDCDEYHKKSNRTLQRFNKKTAI